MRHNEMKPTNRKLTLAAASAATILSVSSALGQTFPLKGVVRDFSRTNPVINTPPSAGNGRYSGNIGLALDANSLPVFTGAGYKVVTEYRDQDAHMIAPHMYVDPESAVTSGVIRLTSTASLSKEKGLFDTYSSNVGPYGGANVGPAPTMQVGAAMPAVSIPASLQAMTNEGNMSFSGASTISSNLHCNRLDGSGTINISGNVSILCEDVMALATNTIISLEPDATLTMYLKAGASSWNHTVLGDSLHPNRIKIYNLSSASFLIHNHAEVYAHLISPNASLDITNHGSVFGQFCGKTLNMLNHGNLHIDQFGGVAMDACGVELHDIEGVNGVASTGGIPSSAAFSKWYTDVLGTNLSMPYTITLTRNAANTMWQYLNTAFYPIDGKLMGNQSQAHNYYFTWTCSAQFVHHGCVDTFMDFSGNDDMWIFVNGQLVMDRGGVLPAPNQYVDMDRLGLVDGNIYTVQMFYSQRSTATSQFKFKTNLDLITDEMVVQYSGPAD
jgi:fibro-slime domain-containing protein